MHEATRNALGVLLREIDGLECKKGIVIGASLVIFPMPIFGNT